MKSDWFQLISRNEPVKLKKKGQFWGTEQWISQAAILSDICQNVMSVHISALHTSASCGRSTGSWLHSKPDRLTDYIHELFHLFPQSLESKFRYITSNHVNTAFFHTFQLRYSLISLLIRRLSQLISYNYRYQHGGRANIWGGRIINWCTVTDFGGREGNIFVACSITILLPLEKFPLAFILKTITNEQLELGHKNTYTLCLNWCV